MNTIPDFSFLDNILLMITKLEMKKNKLNEYHEMKNIDCKILLIYNLIN